MDVVIRSVIIFLVLGTVIRITGKRQIAQLSAFDLILLVTMGDLIGQTILQEDYSLTGGLLAVSTFAVLSIAMGWVEYFLPRSRPVLQGQATVFLRDGQMDEEVMREELIHIADLREAARGAGIRDLADVELAILETNGTFSFFRRRSSSDEDDGTPSPRPPTNFA